MMGFLEKMFAYEYFGTILFSVIAILIVLFFVILYFGKNDEKVRKIEETRKLELANINAFAEQKEKSVELNAEENIIPKEEQNEIAEENLVEDKFEDLKTEINSSFNAPVKDNVLDTKDMLTQRIASFTPVLDPIEPEPIIIPESKKNIDLSIPKDDKMPESSFRVEPTLTKDYPKFNFEELANSISKELEDIDRLSKKVVEEPHNFEIEANIPITPISELTKKDNKPVFSSVFVNKEDNKEEASINQEIFEEQEPLVFPDINFETAVHTNRPKIELPKPAEMPALKEEKIEPKVPDIRNIPDFSNFEGETYNINKAD